MEQGFLMLLKIRFYKTNTHTDKNNNKNLMNDLFLEFSIFLEPRVTDIKESTFCDQ